MVRWAKLSAFVAAIALVAVACSSSSRQTVRLQIFGDGAEIEAYRRLVTSFERSQPGVHIELIAVPRQGDHMTKLSTGFSGGNPPDLFLINYRRFGQFAAKRVLEPLGARLGGSLKESDFYQEALDAFRFKGTLLCLPQNVSSLVVYYNKDLFTQAGVSEPRAGWSWSEFLRAAKRLTRDSDGDGKTDVYGVGTDPTLIRLASFVWQAGAEIVDDTEAPTRMTLLSDDAVRAMKFFIELRRVHGVAPSAAEAASEDYETRFAAGRLGMLLESRRTTAMLREVRALNWDVAPLPRDAREATILHSDAYCMAGSSSRKEAAFRFVSYALGPEGASLIARSGRTVPSLRSVATSSAFLDPAQPPARARVFLDNIPLVRRAPNSASWNEIETKADVRVEEWYYGTEEPWQLGIEIDLDTRDLFVEGD